MGVGEAGTGADMVKHTYVMKVTMSIHLRAVIPSLTPPNTDMCQKELSGAWMLSTLFFQSRTQKVETEANIPLSQFFWLAWCTWWQNCGTKNNPHCAHVPRVNKTMYRQQRMIS